MKEEKRMFKIKLEGGRTAEVEESMYWHTTAHILAQAVKRLFPDYKLTIGPAIENGFYYDFDVEKPFTEDDIAKLEEELENIESDILKYAHDFVKLNELSSQKDEISNNLSEKMDRWMYLEELAQQL